MSQFYSKLTYIYFLQEQQRGPIPKTLLFSSSLSLQRAKVCHDHFFFVYLQYFMPLKCYIASLET